MNVTLLWISLYCLFEQISKTTQFCNSNNLNVKSEKILPESGEELGNAQSDEFLKKREPPFIMIFTSSQFSADRFSWGFVGTGKKFSKKMK